MLPAHETWIVRHRNDDRDVGRNLSALRMGRKFRDRATDEGHRVRERSSEVAGDLRERSEAAYEKGREGLSETTDAARKTVQGVKEVLTRS